MYLLRWFTVCVCVVTATANQLQCDHPQCSNLSSKRDRYIFTVEDNNVEFRYAQIKDDKVSDKFSIECGGKYVLNSPAMPHFSSEFRVSNVILSNCPLSNQNTSIKNTLAALNLTLHSLNDKLFLELTQFPADQLTHQNFLGFEGLTDLKIKNNAADPQQLSLPEPGFLQGLKNLRSVYLNNVTLPAGEFRRFPQSVDQLWLCDENLSSLPSTIPGILNEITSALPDLRHLTLDSYRYTPAVEINSSDNNITNMQSNTPYKLESLQILHWKNRRMDPLEHCEALLKLEIRMSRIEELPERWLAACPRLEEVTIERVGLLSYLPAKLLDGATALKRLTFGLARIESLPEGFLAGAPNLIEFTFKPGTLRGPIPSNALTGPALKLLSLTGNSLQNETLSALSSLTSLTHLHLDSSDLRDVCQDKGYSPLRNLTSLKVLTIRNTYLTQICRDWRENMIYLENLDLYGTRIARLEFTDFIFNRDVSVAKPTVTLGTSVQFVNFTQENYEKALSTPGAGITFNIKRCCSGLNDINCDCDSYWLRRAVIDSHVIKTKNLKCDNHKKFENVTPNEMCPEREIGQ